METTLFGGPPEIGNVLKLGTGQIGFMNTFAYPLFEAVCDILPAMQFTVREISNNKGIWEGKIEQIKRDSGARQTLEGFVSPRTQSPAPPHQLHETLPHVAAPILAGEIIPVPLKESGRSSTASTSHTQLVHDPTSVGSTTNPITYALPLTDSPPNETSRSSSGASKEANIKPTLQARRSSNTVPSQLHLNFAGLDEPLPSTTGSENAPSQERRTSRQRPFTASVLMSSPPQVGGFTQDFSSSTNDSQSRQDWRGQFAPRGHCPPSSGRTSNPTNHDRMSLTTSGTRTHSSTMTAVSPITQATSFLTVDSSEQSFSADSDTRPTSASMPAVLNFNGMYDRRGSEDKTIMTSVSPNGVSEHPQNIRRRRSRLRLAFWRKKSPSRER